jgi:cyclophilin family peptidyl-prolyl cis-trans isomerase
MKPILLFLLCGLAAFQSLRAEDVAVLKLKVGHDKKLKEVVIALDPSAAPETVANFEKLVHKGFYNGLAVHRVFPHLLVQMGDPLSRHDDRGHVGTGGPGYTLAPEIRLKHTVGAVAMARLPDNINPARRSNGSQFYICLKAMPDLDGQYTVFGHVIAGLDSLDGISQQPADTNDNPLDRIVIKSLKMMPREKVAIAPAKTAAH